jgi:hypothetical protein
MNRSQLLVLFGCIPVRIFLAYISTKIPLDKLQLFGIPLLMISLGFLTLYFTKMRMNSPESGTGTVWWHDLRLIHGLFYLMAAVYAFQKKEIVWIPLTMDITFGIIVFIVHYFFQGI